MKKNIIAEYFIVNVKITKQNKHSKQVIVLLEKNY